MTEREHLRSLEPEQSRDGLMTAKEIAHMLGLSARHVQKMAAQREIPCYRFDRGRARAIVRFDAREVREWLRAFRVEARGV